MLFGLAEGKLNSMDLKHRPGSVVTVIFYRE